MKYSQLSNFQKEQYTNYLQTQLQKFSTFMLTQKRQNEKYRALEEAIQCHSDLINQQQSRMQLYDLYHKQNHDSFEHLSKRINKIEEIDDRLRRLEQRERFGCDDPTNLKVKINREGRLYQHHNEEENSRLPNLEQNYKECIKKIKRQQEELSDCRDQIDKIKRRENIESFEGHVNPEKVVQKKDLKKLQKKVVRYLNERLDEIEATIRRKAKSSKSPSAKVSQFSIIDNYTIKNAKSTVNAFQMENQSTNKSEMSTILESKSNKNSNISEKPKLTKRNRDISKSRSKSKSEDKSRNKSKSKNDKGQDRSRSKSERKIKQNKKKAQKEDHSKSRSRSKHILNQSLSVSDESNIFSSKSRSKSHTNQSLSKSKSKKKQTKAPKKGKSREKSLSNTHDLCKKRPQVPANPYVKAIESKVESMAVVIKRKSRVPG